MKPKESTIHLVCVALTIGVVGCPLVLAAQCPGPDTSRPQLRTLASVGTTADDSMRTNALIGACGANGSLIRSSLSLTPLDTSVLHFGVVPLDPVLSTAWNSTIPVSLNDGALWAGRGWNAAVSVGLRAWYGRFRLVVAPQIVTSANEGFPILASTAPARSAFASPFHSGVFSADLPLRFGNAPYMRIDPGETSVEFVSHPVATGITSASLWWGPGVRNALVMSNNAPGIPQAYVRTTHPISTRFGDVEAHMLLGGLSESPFFEPHPHLDLRSLSAAVITLRAAADTGVTVGVARSVYAVLENIGGLPSHFADVLFDWHQPSISGVPRRRSDQIMSLFGQWIAPAGGLELHAEWGKLLPPRSLRELLVDPQLAQGFTVGIDWARALNPSTRVRIQGEATTLEQTPQTPGAEIPEFYASHAVPQGYTQEGQVIGAAIGPGSSSQYIGVDLFHRNWQVGANIGRIRWEDDAFYRSIPGGFTHFGHDVSLFAGLQARLDSRWAGVEVGITHTRRFNYLFQTVDAYIPQDTTFDVRNTTLTLRVTPHI